MTLLTSRMKQYLGCGIIVSKMSVIMPLTRIVLQQKGPKARSRHQLSPFLQADSQWLTVLVILESEISETIFSDSSSAARFFLKLHIILIAKFCFSLKGVFGSLVQQ